MKIVINGQEIPLRFSYSLIRVLSIKWKVTNIEAVLAKIMQQFANAEEDIFSAIDMVTEIVIESAKLTNTEVEANDVGDEMFANPTLMLQVIEEFVNSMPKVSTNDVETLKKKVHKK